MICIGFCLVPFVIKYLAMDLFRIEKNKSTTFHFFLFDEKRKQNLVIDYKKWKNAPLKYMNVLTKYSYLETIEIHTIVTISLVFLRHESTIMFIILAVTLIVSILEHFRRSSNKRNSALTSKKKRTVKKKNYLQKLMLFYVKMYWGFIFFYQIMILLNSAAQLKI